MSFCSAIMRQAGHRRLSLCHGGDMPLRRWQSARRRDAAFEPIPKRSSISTISATLASPKRSAPNDYHQSAGQVEYVAAGRRRRAWAVGDDASGAAKVGDTLCTRRHQRQIFAGSRAEIKRPRGRARCGGCQQEAIINDPMGPLCIAASLTAPANPRRAADDRGPSWTERCLAMGQADGDRPTPEVRGISIQHAES